MHFFLIFTALLSQYLFKEKFLCSKTYFCQKGKMVRCSRIGSRKIVNHFKTFDLDLIRNKNVIYGAFGKFTGWLYHKADC